MSLIDTIYELKDEQSQCLYSNTISGLTIEVREYQTLRWLLIDGIAVQSLMDTDQPSKLLNPVAQIMVTGLAKFNNIDRILNLGFGGGSIERFIWQHFPEVAVDSVESNEIIIHLAREFFSIPDTAPIFHNTADQFLAQTDQLYQLILCDIFIEQSHPDCLYQKEFYLNCQQYLAANGLMIINLTPEDEQDLVNILLPLRLAFDNSYLYQIDGHMNVLVFAANQPWPTGQIHSRYNKVIQQHCPLSLEQVLETLIPLPNSSKKA